MDYHYHSLTLVHLLGDSLGWISFFNNSYVTNSRKVISPFIILQKPPNSIFPWFSRSKYGFHSVPMVFVPMVFASFSQPISQGKSSDDRIAILTLAALGFTVDAAKSAWSPPKLTSAMTDVLRDAELWGINVGFHICKYWFIVVHSGLIVVYSGL